MLTVQGIIDNFYKLSQVPRPSKKEGKVREFLKNWAGEKEVIFQEDIVGNIIITSSGKWSRKESDPIAFQSHIDMVCVQDADIGHDFENDPIQVSEDFDGKISAQGTTLGADNGIWVAAMMSLVDLEDCPPLELLFTVDEEEGMTGAHSIDLWVLSSNRLINLDWEETETLCSGCAGGMFLESRLSLKRVSATHPQYRLVLMGMKWGHSGDEIHKPVGNAIILMCQFIQYHYQSIELVSLRGGFAANAIPVRTEAIIGVSNEGELRWKLNAYASELKKHFDCPGLTYELKSVETQNPVIQDVAVPLEMILSMGTGVVKFYDQEVSSVQTSFNLGKISTDDEFINLEYLLRSSADPELDYLSRKFMQMFGLSHTQISDRHPGWNPVGNRDFMNQVLGIIQDKYPEVVMTQVHAGLECGFFAQKRPDLQMISLGPTIHHPHTTREHIYRKDIEVFVDYLRLILAFS